MPGSRGCRGTRRVFESPAGRATSMVSGSLSSARVLDQLQAAFRAALVKQFNLRQGCSAGKDSEPRRLDPGDRNVRRAAASRWMRWTRMEAPCGGRRAEVMCRAHSPAWRSVKTWTSPPGLEDEASAAKARSMAWPGARRPGRKRSIQRRSKQGVIRGDTGGGADRWIVHQQDKACAVGGPEVGEQGGRPSKASSRHVCPSEATADIDPELSITMTAVRLAPAACPPIQTGRESAKRDRKMSRQRRIRASHSRRRRRMEILGSAWIKNSREGKGRGRRRIR